MVTTTQTASRLMIIAKPNHSSSWRANLLVLMALAVPSLGSAIAFAALGAWPILPFAGLELLALGCALYYVNWKLQYRHVITLSKDQVRIDKGFYVPRQSWQFSRQGAGLAVSLTKETMHKPLIEAVTRALDNENEALNKAFGTADFFEAIGARKEKRAPDFKGT